MSQTRNFTWDIAEEVLNVLDMRAHRNPDVAAVRDALLDALPTVPSGDPSEFPVTLPAGTWQSIDALSAGDVHEPQYRLMAAFTPEAV